MTPRPYLTTGLNHLPRPRLLEPGEIFIVRFKNSLRGYKSDVWIAVVLPNTFGPSRHVDRRPVGAQPVDGEWLTHLKDRVYPMYLPARNMYRWTALSDVFVLGQKTHNVLRRAGREADANVWDDLMAIIRSDPGLEFWKNMALQEEGAKGKRGKDLRIVLPDGHDDLLPCRESDKESESERETQDDDEEDEEDEEEDEEKEADEKEDQNSTPKNVERETGVASDPLKMQKIVRSYSDLRAVMGSQSTWGALHRDSNSVGSAIELVSFANNRSISTKLIPKLPPFVPLTSSNSSHPSPLPSVMSSSTIQTMESSSVPPTKTAQIKTEADASLSVPVSTSQENPTRSIFDMTISHALEHVFLGQIESAKIIDVFQGAVILEKQPEYVHIRSYLTDGEFLPRVIELNSPEFKVPTSFAARDAKNNSIMRVIGDQMGIGQNFKLNGVTTNLDLEEIILILGKVYVQARRFGLMHMVYRIAFKLQVAWNCYPDLYQCKPLLEVASLAFAGCTEFDIEACDYLQSWMIHLLAEASDLLTYNSSEQFWSLLRAHPKLQDVVLHLRTLAHVHNPELYGNTRALLYSRGVSQL